MTYFDTAAARRTGYRIARAAFLASVALALAGCETSGGVFGSSAPSVADPPQQQAALPPPRQLAKLAIAPVIGAPDGVSKQLAKQLGDAVASRNMAVVGKDERADYTLRGYVVASKDKAASKIAYIWDVTDGGGKRINRITGEERVANPQGRDPWSLVGPEVTQNIADKTATSVASWLAAQGGGAQAPAIPSGVGASAGAQPLPPPAQQAAAGAQQLQPQQAVAKNLAPAVASAGGTKDVLAMIPPVLGAPGDGNGALAEALRRELDKNGVGVVPQGVAAAPGAYKVIGKVDLGRPADGKQQIRIDWQVRDAAGKSLGTVSQKNEIPQGSLDGEWGRTADAAAAAAAQGILKLLPQPRSTN